MLSGRYLSCLSVCDVDVYYGQTVGQIKMKLGTDVGLGPGDFVLDGGPSCPQKRHSPQFSAYDYCG